MNIQEKLDNVVSTAQSYILSYLKDYIDQNQLTNIEELFRKCPIVLGEVGRNENEFGKTENIGGYAEEDKIVIDKHTIESANVTDLIAYNRAIGTIIHEYAHKIRGINNQYGEMFEEAFASIFAEACINSARIESNSNQEVFNMLDSIKYQKAESQVRALLYVLKQNGLDKSVIAKYIACDDEKFKQECSQVFGTAFEKYFEDITNKNNNSEQMTIDLITQYIKEKGLNINNYHPDINDLYLHGSPTLERAVVNAGIDSFLPEEQQTYNFFESSVKIANERGNFIGQEQIDRIRQTISTKFSLNGKSIDEIYDTIIDLISEYNINKNKDNEESKIFISEVEKMVPNIEEFKSKFINLRVSGKDKLVLNNINLENISYDDIYARINTLSQVEDLKSNLESIFQSVPTEQQAPINLGGSIPREPAIQSPENYGIPRNNLSQEFSQSVPEDKAQMEEEKQALKEQLQRAKEELSKTLEWANSQENKPISEQVNEANQQPTEYPDDLYIQNPELVDYIHSNFKNFGKVDKILSVSGYPDPQYEVRFENGEVHTIMMEKNSNKSNISEDNNNFESSDVDKKVDAMIQAMVNGTLDTNGQPLVENQEQMTNGRQMGFAKAWILGIITTLVTVGIIVLGIFIMK